MLTGELRTQVDRVWDAFWTGGISSQLAQKIDRLENPGEKFGFTGYLLFFHCNDSGMNRMRAELKKVINQHPTLLSAMKIPVEEVYASYPNGFDL